MRSAIGQLLTREFRAWSFCATPLDNVVGGRGRGMSAVGRTLDVERVLAAGISLGIGRAALDLHVQHLKQREAFGRSLGSMQVLQHAAADSITDLTAARALAACAVAAIDSGAPPGHWPGWRR